jgi:transposase
MARRTDPKPTRRRVRDDGWRLPDALWAKMEPLLPPRPKHPLGCHNPRVPDRAAMDAIFFVLRTGCQWNALRETTICSSSSAHRRFQEWLAAGVFEAFWREGLLAYDALRGIDWTWLALDGAMGKAPLGGGKNRPQPDGSGQARGQALAVDRRPRRASRGCDRRRQPQRPQADASHP